MRNRDIKKLINMASDSEEQSVDSEEIKMNLMEKISKKSITKEQSEGETVNPIFVTVSHKEKKYSFAKITAGAVAACLGIGVIGLAAYKNSYGLDQLPTFDSDNVSDTVQYTSLESTSDLQPEVSKNEPQTFTEDFDGIVMTVTTDKTEYLADETIKVKAVVKNTTNETIWLYVHTSTPNIHQEIGTTIVRDGRYLIDPVAESSGDCAIAFISIDPGKEYVQDMDFETYFHINGIGSNKEPAEKGLYSGKCAILVFSKPIFDISNQKSYSVDFSLTLG